MGRTTLAEKKIVEVFMNELKRKRPREALTPTMIFDVLDGKFLVRTINNVLAARPQFTKVGMSKGREPRTLWVMT